MLLDQWSLTEETADWVPPSRLATPAPRPPAPPRQLPAAPGRLDFTFAGTSTAAATGRRTASLTAVAVPAAFYATGAAVLPLAPAGAPVAAHSRRGTHVAATFAAVATRRVATPLLDDELVLALLMEE